ncbi:MAG: DUF2914 domain-containing protein [Deltaproteobacteria bacterium]|nr:DUF2914 domain-containing protein [Deltaproteobacteria bacterium]
MRERIREFHKKHERWFPLAFFVFGFLFDAVMIRRIDEPMVIIQQAAYLVAAGALICMFLMNRTFWKYQEELLHFLLGTLLNAYMIFYFKAASLFASLGFILLLCGLLYFNESKRFRNALFCLCLTSYFVCMVPIALGALGWIPFVLGLLAATLAIAPMVWFLLKRDLAKPIVLPFLAVQAAFALLYFLEMIPPVPLSVTSIGIYHDIRKANGAYELVSTRSRWRFWQKGDQLFTARAGDRIFCFARIFSPSRFKDKLQVRWLHYDERHGWMHHDAIPLPVVGGREEGFRGFTVKSNYEPGEWRVQVETSDNRELGRIYFRVVADAGSEERPTHVDVD